VEIVAVEVGPALDQSLAPTAFVVRCIGADWEGGAAIAVSASKATIVSTNELRRASIEIPL
jgi:hypothetical protein